MIFKKFAAFLLALFFTLSMALPSNAAGVQIRQSTAYTANILGTDLWRAEIPTSILLTDKYSGYLTFPITAIAPYSLLADKAYGVDVEFELWTVTGKKLGSDTVYSFDWNPVASQTQVEIYLRAEDMKGAAVLRVRTEQTRSTTGLLSRYVETVANFDVSLAQGTPPDAPWLNWSKWVNNSATFQITPPASSRPITSYEIYVQPIISDDLSPTLASNFGTPILLKSQSSTLVSVSPDELQLLPGLLSKKYILFNVKAVSEVGASDAGRGVYSESANFLPRPSPTATPSPTQKPASPVKYGNCAALNQVYKGGVARSAKWTNKGASLKLTPVVNEKVYNLNKGLDRDKDGLACEK
jgi:hypothetical protein